MILDGQSPQSIAAAAQALQRGELVGLPTETVYGLAADAGNDAAVAQIFEVRKACSALPAMCRTLRKSSLMRFGPVL
jgi:L-threonylcarbamoyladenylate synthase